MLPFVPPSRRCPESCNNVNAKQIMSALADAHFFENFDVNASSIDVGVRGVCPLYTNLNLLEDLD